MTEPPSLPTPTRDWLDRAALAYLERYAASSAHLGRVLQRKVERRARRAGIDPAPFLPLVPATVARMTELGLLDDKRYAEAMLVSLRRRGASARLAASRLAAKGVDRETAEAVIGADATDEPAAAMRLAKRKRLGPFRLGERDPWRERDMAALARAGFSYEIARRVVDADASEEAVSEEGSG